MSETALAKIDQKAMVRRIDGCEWAKDMTPAQRQDLADIAITYELDPLMGELVCYQGKPLITFDGHSRIAGRDSRFEGLDLRPLTQEEKKQYGVEKVPYVWLAEAWKKGMRVPARQIGTADPDRPFRSRFNANTNKWEGGNPVERERPWALARTRAGNAALKLYFPHKIPGVDSAVDADVYVENGRVIDGTFREIRADDQTSQREPVDFPGKDLFSPPEEPPPQDSTLSGDPPKTKPPKTVPAGPKRSQPAGKEVKPEVPAADEPSDNAEPEDTLPFQTRREELTGKIKGLVAEIGGKMDDKFKDYFKLREGVVYQDATDEQLEHFVNHSMDLLAKRQEKKKPPAA